MRAVRWIPVLFSTACAAGVVQSTTVKSPEDTAGPEGAVDTTEDSEDSADSGEGDTAAPVAGLEEALTLDALLGHLDALQSIADTHGANRNTYGEGFRDSVEYAAAVFEDAGYTVTRQTFEMSGYSEGNPPELSQTVPATESFSGRDLRTLTYSAGGDVTAPLTAVDLVLPPGSSANTSTSGCESSDFAGFEPGHIALIQRGSCNFSDKVALAEAAGASAVLVFNEGQAGRTEVESWTLDPARAPSIPVLGTSFDVGNDLATALEAGSVEVRVVVDASIVSETVTNLLAELDVGDPDQLVVVGAHLDSVTAGPGINDNGSGTAFVLAAAQAAAATELSTTRRIRWALWGAEEVGLVGSDYYVSELSSAELGRHVANLNFDMIGSPNGGRFIYDGDGSATGYAGPAGSDGIEALFEEFFDAQGLSHAPTAFDGRSDYGPFIWAGIPAGGLFSGAEVRKSSSEEELFGGVAGVPLDECYHQSCDTRYNLDETLLFEMSRAAAYVTHQVANGGGLAGPPPPHRVPVARVDPHDIPAGHGHGCHPVSR